MCEWCRIIKVTSGMVKSPVNCNNSSGSNVRPVTLPCFLIVLCQQQRFGESCGMMSSSHAKSGAGTNLKRNKVESALHTSRASINPAYDRMSCHREMETDPATRTDWQQARQKMQDIRGRNTAAVEATSSISTNKSTIPRKRQCCSHQCHHCFRHVRLRDHHQQC